MHVQYVFLMKYHIYISQSCNLRLPSRKFAEYLFSSTKKETEEEKRKILGLVKGRRKREKKAQQGLILFSSRKKEREEEKEKYWAWLNLIFLNGERKGGGKIEKVVEGLISFFLDEEGKGWEKEKMLCSI